MTKRIAAIIALSLVLIICVGAMSGCFLFESGRIGGRRGAMLALANERLRGNLVGGGPLFSGAEEDLKDMADLGRSFSGGARLMSLTYSGSAEFITPDGFVTTDRTNTQFNETVMRSVSLADQGAEYIRMMKESVRVLDTWVQVGENKLLLHVEENSELLLSLYEEAEETFVCYRTRDERGIERYELLIDSRQTGFTMRAVYIENSVYEYMEIFNDPNSNSEFYIGFRAENVEGSWECMEMRYFPINGADAFEFRHIILREDLCFAAGINKNTNEIGSISISTADRKVDIMMALEKDETSSTFVLPLGAFSGYSGISYEGERNSFMVLKDGTRVQFNSEYNENIRIGSFVKSESAWGTEGEFFINVYGNSVEERRGYFKQALADWQLECVEPIDRVFDMISEADDIVRVVHAKARWHGEKIDSYDSCMRAVDTENAIFDKLFGFYEKYKNNEEASLFDIELGALAQFADLRNVDATVSVSDDGLSFTLSRAVATVEDLTLFTMGDEYCLAVALKNDGGLIHLDGYSVNYKVAEGDSLTLDIGSNLFDVSVIAPGAYDIVVYAATKDGIRSTAPATVGKIIIP